MWEEQKEADWIDRRRATGNQAVMQPGIREKLMS